MFANKLPVKLTTIRNFGFYRRRHDYKLKVKLDRQYFLVWRYLTFSCRLQPSKKYHLATPQNITEDDHRSISFTTKVDQIRLFSDVLKNQAAPIHIKSTWIYLVLWSIWLLWAWLMEALGHIWLLPGLAEDCHGPIVHCHRSKYVITDSQVNLRNCRRCWWKSVNLPNTMFKIREFCDLHCWRSN